MRKEGRKLIMHAQRTGFDTFIKITINIFKNFPLNIHHVHELGLLFIVNSVVALTERIAYSLYLQAIVESEIKRLLLLLSVKL